MTLCAVVCISGVPKVPYEESFLPNEVLLFLELKEIKGPHEKLFSP